MLIDDRGDIRRDEEMLVRSLIAAEKGMGPRRWLSKFGGMAGYNGTRRLTVRIESPEVKVLIPEYRDTLELMKARLSR